jgi:signal peptidase I
MEPQIERRAACCELVAEVARSAGQVRLIVSGASMLPALWPGDLVTVRRCEAAELQPGSIAVYRREEKLIAHRIVRITAGELIARGDSRPRCDRPVAVSAVIGVVDGIVRNGRRVSAEPSPGRTVVSWMLRRSELCTRLLLRVSAVCGRRAAADAVREPAPPLPLGQY